MAECITAQFGNTYCPQLKLIVTGGTDTATSTTFAWELQYVAHGFAFYTSSSKAVSATFDGKTIYSGNYSINGKTGTYKIAGGSVTVNKGTSSRRIPFGCSINFGTASWNGVSGGSKSASSTYYIGAKTSYTVTYNANGGSGAPGKQTKWHGTNITLSTTRPTRTGYTFAGWATSASGSVSYQPGQTYSANSNVTLYAKWTAITYTVSYNANGGSGAPGNQAKTYGVTLTLSSTKPTRTNYNFKGWGTSSSSTTVAYAAGASYTANASITLYAIWELAYIKPRITNLRADRCNSSGTLIDDGTYALVKFNWSTDRTVSSIKVAGVSVSASGTSGSVSKVVGGSYIEENEYAIAVSVSDSGGTTNGTTTLSAMIFAIDLLKGGKGIAFGQPAKNANLLDSVWPIEAPSFKGQLLTEGDNRTVATSPSDYKSSIRFVGLKQQSVIGLSAGSTYAYVIGLKGWSDQSGGLAHELAFANGGIYARIATSDSAWGSWKKLIYASQMSDLVQIKEQTVATSLTLAAHSGQSISYTPASISGYKFVQMIGGKGNGDVGLMCSAGSTWVFNASTSSKTYSSVSFYLLYVKSSF